MLRNYIKIAVRNLFKKKGYSFVNIFGLAIGIATSLLIISFVLHELSYDDYHENSDRLFRVIQTMETDDKTEEQASTPFPLGPVLKTGFPNQVQDYVRFYNLQENSHTILNRKKNISFRESNIYFVDSTFFNFFTAKLLQGNPDEVLKNPESIVISKSIAEKYFGDENPVGQQLSFKGVSELTVTGVMDDWPEESHLKIDLLASFSTLDRMYANSPGYDESWFWNPVWTYILVEDGTSITQLESQINTLRQKYYYASSGWPEQETVDIYLQAVPDIHLHSNRDNEMNANSSILYIYILLAVSVFILLIACINFMNLATVRSLERSREVGLRKVLGGHRKQLFNQFMGESFFVTLISVIAGILLVYLTLPYFNSLVGKELSFQLFNSYYTIPIILIMTLIVGLISGAYPAVFLSKFEPVKVLKGFPAQGNSGTTFRKVLVVFQFALSVILITGTAILFLQL
jgi:putative ABC transport system permease protein